MNTETISSNDTATVKVSGDGSLVIEGLTAATTKAPAKAKMSDEEKAAKAFAKKKEAFEAKAALNYPHYVQGSYRVAATDSNIVHGIAVDCTCTACGARYTLNPQDVFQKKFCPSCAVEAKKALAKAKRAEIRATLNSLKAQA